MQSYRHEGHAPEDHIDAHEEPECPRCRAGKSRKNDTGEDKINDAADIPNAPTAHADAPMRT
jgi:hypothetical protein